MGGTSDHLLQTLTKLHQALEAAEDLDEESRERLRAALADIQAKLGEGDDPGGGLGEVPDWVDRLRQSAREFQTSHPDLVRAVDRVARALSNIGF